MNGGLKTRVNLLNLNIKTNIEVGPQVLRPDISFVYFIYLIYSEILVYLKVMDKERTIGLFKINIERLF